MTRPCGVCTSPYRDSIDRRLLSGDSLRDIARDTEISKSAIQRHHVEGHINMALVKSSPPAVIAEDATLQQQLRDLHGRTLALLASAESSKDGRMALAAIRECRSNLEVLAKIELVLLARAAPKGDDNITVTFDHNDQTPPPFSSLGVGVVENTDQRRKSLQEMTDAELDLIAGMPDGEIESKAIEVLREHGYTVTAPNSAPDYREEIRRKLDAIVDRRDKAAVPDNTLIIPIQGGEAARPAAPGPSVSSPPQTETPPQTAPAPAPIDPNSEEGRRLSFQREWARRTPRGIAIIGRGDDA